MTFNSGNVSDCTPDRPPTCLEPRRQVIPDILCCQSVLRTVDGNVDTNSLLPISANMTCGCFAVGRQHANRQTENEKGVSGLAMFIATGVWMLNSGSFVISGNREEEDWTVQFALIRKGTVAVLVLNLQFPAVLRGLKTQMRTLFSHPLLKERYGAVVVCGDRQPPLSNKARLTIAGSSNYLFHAHQSPSAPAHRKGMLWLLAPREQNIAVTMPHLPRHNESLPIKDLGQLNGLTLTFEVTRATAGNKTRIYLPLSFREQWLGNRDSGRLSAAT
jgi:hypothetical protein